MQQRWIVLIVALGALLFLSGCAAGPNQLKDTPNQEDNVAGFWRGLWQGCTVLFTFIISLFSDNVNVYEVHNNGGFYNFGFLIGVSLFFGGAGSSSS